LLPGVTLIVVTTSVLLVLTGVLSRRRFDMCIRTIRITLTGPLGLGAGIEFMSRFVWNTDSYTPAISPPDRRDRAVHGRFPEPLRTSRTRGSIPRITPALARNWGIDLPRHAVDPPGLKPQRHQTWDASNTHGLQTPTAQDVTALCAVRQE